MRLLNSSTSQLEFFPDKDIPEYAILSHTWGKAGEEVTFEDLRGGEPHRKEKGYEKLKYSCKQAAAEQIGYVWIDTCCINKESSAELSESINSMFLWYQKAKICYAYLTDVPTGIDPHNSSEFNNSNWFTRGWTLQELIAPSNLAFYSKDWVEIGSKSDLASTISRITRIDEGILTGLQDLKSTSVAKRMSWASDRKTTRLEDMAYCLMGLFNVNMAMLYGEGEEKSFRRLQEEIMKDSDDETLFAWTNTRESQPSQQGLLAKSPADFRKSGHYIPYCDWEPRTPYSITSRGLCITLSLHLLEGDTWIGTLECPVPPEYDEFLGIYLKRLSKEDQQYARV
ncbi:HET-domain-containing protein, partial [Glonium stellatum]